MRLILLFCIIFISIEGIVYSQTNSNITVINGYGSGEYKQGDTIHIWAKEFSDDSVFAGWETPMSSVEIAKWNEWHTSIIVRGSSAIIRAKFRYSKPLQFTETKFRILGADRNIWYAFPPNPIGLITLHHFTNGTGNLWTSRTEYRQFCHAAYDKGYALLAFNADEVERGDQTGNGLKQWQALPIDITKNIDHRVTRILLDSLIERKVITNKTPIYAVGMSVGGGYSLGVAMSLGFCGWANYCSGGSTAISDSTTIPGLFCPAENDANREDDIGGNTIKAYQNYSKLQQRGVNVGYLLNIRHPLYPERFARVNGINKAKSVALFNELKNGGWLDSLNRPILLPDSLEKGIRYTQFFPEFSDLKEELWKEALYQYRVAFADHEFHADYTYTTLDFFDAQKKNTNSQSVFCDSIYIDSVKIITEQPFKGDMMIYFRNEGSKWWSYPIVNCSLEVNFYYKANAQSNVISIFHNKSDLSDGRTNFNVSLQKTTEPNDVPNDFILNGIATLLLLNEQNFTYDTCTFAISFKPNQSAVNSVEFEAENQLKYWSVVTNLTDELLTVCLADMQGKGIVVLSDILGNQVLTLEINSTNQVVISTEQLPSGVYIIQLKINGDVITKTIQIVR